MTRGGRNRLSVSVVVLALGTLVGIGWLQRDRFAPAATGERAPEFSLPAVDGQAVSLRSYEGRVVLLNVWATWCAPCRWEMPALERLHRELRPAGLEVLAISVDGDPRGLDARGRVGDVAAYVADMKLTFTVLRDARQDVQRRYGVNGLPTSFLIDRQGRIRKKVIGPAEWDRPPYADAVRALLEE